MDPDKDWDQYWRLLFKVGQDIFSENLYTQYVLEETPRDYTWDHL